MGKYIDAEHAEFRLQCCGTYHGVIAFDTVKAVLNDAPSIEIVRCKECKWRGIPTACPIDNFYAQRWTKDDDFCSRGEREGE